MINMSSLNWMVDLWAWNTAHAAWQAALVGCIAILFVRVATRVPAQIRYSILLLAIAKFAFPPLQSLPTGLFGFVSVSQTLEGSTFGTETDQSSANSRVALGTTADDLRSSESGNIRSIHSIDIPANSNELERQIETSKAPSAREILTGAIQAPLPHSSTAQGRTIQSASGRTLEPTFVSKPSAVWNSIATVNTLSCLAAVHSLGMIVCSLLLSRRMWRLYMRRRSMIRPGEGVELLYRQTAKDLGTRRLPELLISMEDAGPYSFGVLRPTIVLPANCVEELPTESLRIALAHELVHHRRGDLLVNAMQIAVAVVWWFHPIAWLVNRAIRQVREDCCDDTLLETGIARPSDYCQVLLNVASLSDQPRIHPGTAMGMTTNKIPLEYRLRRIMDQRITRRSRLSWTMGLGLILVALFVLPGLTQKPAIVEIEPQETAHDSTAVFSAATLSERTQWPSTSVFRLLDVDGKPVAGAPVEFSYTYRNKTAKQLRSDDNGVVRILWPQKRPRWATVTVKSPKHVHQFRRWDQRPMQCKVPPTKHDFQLIAGVPIGGVVTDGADGIEGVTINATITGPKGSADYITVTNADGRWEIPNAPAQFSRVQMQLVHDEYVSDPNEYSRTATKNDLEALRTREFTANLSRGNHLSGQVTDEQGTPIENVQLKLNSEYMADHAWTPRTDKLGKFQFPHCTPDLESYLLVFHPEFSPQRIPVRLEGESLTQNVKLVRGTPIRFKILDQNRSPVPGVSLSFAQWSGVFNGFTWDDEFEKPESDSNGDCIWNCAPEDPFEYGFFRYGWTRPRSTSHLPSSEPIEIQMYPQPSITVRAVDEVTGESIQDFKAISRVIHSERRTVRGTAEQSSSGQAELQIRDSSYKYFVRIEALGYAPAESEPQDVKEGDLDVVLKLKRTSAISGVVREPDGSPAQGATVIMGTKDVRPYIRAGGETSSPELKLSTGTDGAFAFADPGEDFTLFVFSKSGFTHIRKEGFESSADVQVQPYARVEGSILEPFRTADATKVNFHFNGEWGAQSFFGPHCHFDIQTVADANGDFTFDLPGGVNGTVATTRVLAKHGQFTTMGRGPSQSLTLVAGDTVHVTLGQVGRRVIGQVQRGDSLPNDCDIGSGTFSLASRLGNSFEPNVKAPTSHFAIDDSGKFEINGVPPGKYTVSITAWDQTSEHPGRKSIGRFRKWITVPNHDVGQSRDQTFDLGLCSIQPNGNLGPPAQTAASAREHFKLARADVSYENFDTKIRCVDSKRQPMRATIKVWYGNKTGLHIENHQAGADGDLSLSELPAHGAWVFANIEGYQSTGLFVGPEAPEVEIQLLRDDELRPVVQKAGWSDGDDNSNRMAKFLLGRTVKRILEGKDEHLKFSSVLLLAKSDAKTALDLYGKYAIDHSAFGDEQSLADFSDAAIRYARCVELAAEDHAAADLLIKSIMDGRNRARAYAGCIAVLAKTEGQSPWIQNWLKLGLNSAKADATPHWQAIGFAQLAQAILDAGEPEELAKRALERAQTALRSESDDEQFWYYARSMVAWELARVDVDSAVALIQSELDAASIKAADSQNANAAPQIARDAQRGRLLGNLAHQIALTDPKRAIQVLDACQLEYRDSYCPRVCYRIAKLDSEQALKLAETCKSQLARGHALGAIADAVAEQDREKAIEILERAFNELEDVTESEEVTHKAVSVACSLLPTVAKVDPGMLDAFKWRALSMRRSKQSHSPCRGPVCDLGLVDDTSQLRLGDGLLGATIARYDAQLGRKIAFADGDDTLNLPFDKAPYYLFGIAFLTAPEQTVLALSKLPLETTTQQRVALSALEQVVGLVGLDETQRWHWLMDEQFQLWRPDKFDF